jgi:hypothetical protein
VTKIFLKFKSQGWLQKKLGQYDAYVTYLRALLASIGDVNWCTGSCRITQVKEEGLFENDNDK